MQLAYYHVQAFADRSFGGNPAGVCLLENTLPDELLQKIAAENNLSETAFCLPISSGDYQLRWFTPQVEIDLCGHATLATAHVLWQYRGELRPTLTFKTLSGLLTVDRNARGLITLDFPSRPARPMAIPPHAAAVLSAAPFSCGLARDYLFEFQNEDEVENLKPDFARLATWDQGFGVIVTAPGRAVDFVSRFFAPRAGVPEDPVTGSAHCTLIPYWAERLGKKILRARQVSARGGDLYCELRGNRVKIAGHAVTYSRGIIELTVS